MDSQWSVLTCLITIYHEFGCFTLILTIHSSQKTFRMIQSISTFKFPNPKLSRYSKHDFIMLFPAPIRFYFSENTFVSDAKLSLSRRTRIHFLPKYWLTRLSFFSYFPLELSNLLFYKETQYDSDNVLGRGLLELCCIYWR